MRSKKTLLVLWATLVLNGLLATDYYVSKQGDDQNMGTSISPFRTINHALTKMSPGDNCFVANGTYNEVVTFPESGTCDQPISLIAEGDEVMITGTKTATDWIQGIDGIFKTYFPEKVTQLFLNRKPQVKAKYPNQPADTNLFNTTTFTLQWLEADNTIISQELNQSGNYWKNATIWAMVGHRWVSQTAKITFSSGQTLSFDYNSYPGDHGVEGVGFLTNTIHALDTIGEWHWENDTLYYIPQSQDMIEQGVVEAKIRDWVIDLSDKEYIHIQGIKTMAGAINMDEANYCVLKDMEVKYLSEYDYVDKEKTSWASTWSRNEWTNIDTPNGIGIGVFGKHNRIEGCHISWSAGDGITLFGDSNLVLNSTIHDCNYRGTDCNPISLAGKGNQILQNTIYNGGRSVIQSVGVGGEYKVKYNRLYQSGLVNWDVGVFYAFDIEGDGAEVAYNWISQGHSNNPESWGAGGIYIDNNCKDFLIHHNVIWDIKESGIKMNMPANDHKVYHNTIFNTGEMSTYLHPDYAHLPSANCVFYNNYVDYTFLLDDWLTYSNNVSREKDLLVEREELNFLPDAASLIDKGMVIEGINDNFSGKAPDIGAYEIEKKWSVGPYSNNLDCDCSTCEKGKAGNCDCSYWQESVPTGIFKYDTQPNPIKIFPNPAQHFLNISFLDIGLRKGKWQIFDMRGYPIMAGDIKGNADSRLSIANLSNASYILKVRADGKDFCRVFEVLR